MIEVSSKEEVETTVLNVEDSRLAVLMDDSRVVVGIELLATELVELSVNWVASEEVVKVLLEESVVEAEELLGLTYKDVEAIVCSELVVVADEFKVKKLELVETVEGAELMAVELRGFEIETVLAEGRTPVPGLLRVGKVAEDVAFVVAFDHG